MNNPLVSIIIPIYNSEAFLDKCIQSAINQSYKNIEVILVDDGSIDSSGEICDNYSSIDNRIKTIHKNNGGLVNARKTGLKSSTGEYVLYIDGDDWIELNLIEKLEDNNNVGYDKLEIDFARQLKDILEKLKHGEI